VNTDGLSIEEVHQKIAALLQERNWF